MSHKFSQLKQAFLITSLIEMASLFKVNYIWGSKMALFSGSNVMAPIAGLWGGTSLTMFIMLLRRLLRSALLGTTLLNPLAYFIPTLFASFYWQTRSPIFRLVVPIICMMLFAFHPVGSQALAYSCYWLIPIVLYCLPYNNLFLTALGSTFVGHAVGSVVWLYTMPMTSAEWLALIPVVAVERLLFATGMVAVHLCATALMTYLPHIGGYGKKMISSLGVR